MIIALLFLAYFVCGIISGAVVKAKGWSISNSETAVAIAIWPLLAAFGALWAIFAIPTWIAALIADQFE